jgi:hypothetical protein
LDYNSLILKQQTKANFHAKKELIHERDIIDKSFLQAVRLYNKKVETLKQSSKALIFKAANEKLISNLPDNLFDTIEFISKDLHTQSEIAIYQKYCQSFKLNIKGLIEEWVNKFLKILK